MGSPFIKNDTLKISKAQGFPSYLDISKHVVTPFTLADVDGKEFEFRDKENIRIYNVPPVRTFLAEEIEEKWIYWGLCFITNIQHDYEKSTTAGAFKIIQLYTPEEMQQMFNLTHFVNKDQNYFA